MTITISPDEHEAKLARLEELARERTEIERVLAESIIADPPTTPVRDDELDPRVQKGALFLDEHVPGWADRIDLRTFRLQSAFHCVVGQLYGVYSRENLRKLSGRKYTDRFSHQHAFMADRENDWGPLENDWEKAISARKCRS